MKKLIFIAVLFALVAPVMAAPVIIGGPWPMIPVPQVAGSVDVEMIIPYSATVDISGGNVVLTDVGGNIWEGATTFDVTTNFDVIVEGTIVPVGAGLTFGLAATWTCDLDNSGNGSGPGLSSNTFVLWGNSPALNLTLDVVLENPDFSGSVYSGNLETIATVDLTVVPQ